MTSRIQRGAVLAGLAIAGLFFARRASAASNFDPNGTPVLYVPDDYVNYEDGGAASMVDTPMGDLLPPSAVFDDNIDWSVVDFTGSPLQWNQDAFDMATTDQNLNAFLYMIRSAEHRFPQDVVDSEQAYQTFYGGSLFWDLSDHPVNTGEMRGVPLPAAMCRAAGFTSGVCVSTAAGAYQFTRPTWNSVRGAGAWGPRLPDFTPESQDEAARRLLKQVGALPFVLSGDFQSAIGKAARTWASLPGSKAQQNPKSLDFALARINESLTGVA